MHLLHCEWFYFVMNCDCLQMIINESKSVYQVLMSLLYLIAQTTSNRVL